MRFFGRRDIKTDMRDYIRARRLDLLDRTIVDIPAGTGVTSSLLRECGARVLPYDLFPELFRMEGLQCTKADLRGVLPIADGSADFVFCQEGIEHLPDQLHALGEFNRVLKVGGELILTTPNYSKLRSRLSYLLAESEYAFKRMPPNEVDSIWYSVYVISGSGTFGSRS